MNEDKILRDIIKSSSSKININNLDNSNSITCEDIDKFVEQLMNQEIKDHECFKCSKRYYGSYGHHIGECDECWFSRFPREEMETFFKSFFE
jgi:hypothetical protein